MNKLKSVLKKQALLTGLMLSSLTFYSFGQSETKAPTETIPSVVTSNVNLNAQRVKLDAKKVEMNQATTSTRAQVSKLKEEYHALKEEYLRLLLIELENSNDPIQKEQLQKEFDRYQEKSNTQIK